MVVTKSTPEEEAACVTFLKWFTQPENNIQFAVGSGYLPVTHAADDVTAIENSGLDLTDSMKDVLANAIDAVETTSSTPPSPLRAARMPARCWNTACRTWPARTARRWKSSWPPG